MKIEKLKNEMSWLKCVCTSMISQVEVVYGLILQEPDSNKLSLIECNS